MTWRGGMGSALHGAAADDDVASAECYIRDEQVHETVWPDTCHNPPGLIFVDFHRDSYPTRCVRPLYDRPVCPALEVLRGCCSS